MKTPESVLEDLRSRMPEDITARIERIIGEYSFTWRATKSVNGKKLQISLKVPLYEISVMRNYDGWVDNECKKVIDQLNTVAASLE